VGSEVREVEVTPGAAPGAFSVKVGDRLLPVSARVNGDGALLLIIDREPVEAFVVRARGGAVATVCLGGEALAVSCRTGMEEQLARAAEAAGESMEAQVRTSMPGKIVEVRVQPGDVVAAGQRLLVLEAMKMENEIQAKGAARVKAVLVRTGEAVESGALLVELERVEAE
jgi:biotin carboxyl carrier protein